MPSVSQNMDGHFTTGHEFLDEQGATGIAEDAAIHDAMNGLGGFVRILGNNDTFARSEAIGLDDLGINRVLLAIGISLHRVGEARAGSRGQTVLEEKILGENFAAFELGSCLVRSKDGEAGLFKAIDDACAKRGFRADDGEIRFFLRCPCDETIEVGDVQRQIRAEPGGACIAGSGEKLKLRIIAAEVPGDGVFAPA